MTSHTYSIVGMHFRPPAKALLASLPTGARLSIVPEPTNPFDANALSVWVEPKELPASQMPDLESNAAGFGFSLEQILSAEGWHLGYIPAVISAGLAPAVTAACEADNPHFDGTDPCSPQTIGYVSGTLGFDAKGNPTITFTLEP